MRNEYEVYRHKHATDADFDESDKFFKQVEHEDKALCNAAQVNLNLGTYSIGQLQPEAESGVLYSQDLIRRALQEHRQKEKEAGREIWPTRLTVAGENADVLFCQKLGTCEATIRQVEW